MARATTMPTRRPPSAVASAKYSTAAPSVRLFALPVAPAPPRKRACACSPTTHPGSFRCALHRGAIGRLPSSPAAPPVPSGLSAARRPSMASPLVRIAAVEGDDSVRRALAALVRPSSRPRRRDAFRPRPSRLCAMSYAADNRDHETCSSSSPKRFQ
ncbi:hypothetical protein PR202_ga30623 [Eleusine coracana subsp. coracana]|uniref:Uncharacterized protein n=1 Tax=Eleusine coracana subsp. coracana TaxID=191504 RepID=A0AAV5DPV3_ELECO|nr:hypothetical protein PR202_ga30623 [Eleusine coracana subsp. coracana]